MTPSSSSRRPGPRSGRGSGPRPGSGAGSGTGTGSGSGPAAARTSRGPAPVTRGRALGALGGLLAFTLGFAVAGVAVLLDRGGSPPYLVGIALGLVGMGLIGFHYQRAVAQLPQGRLWSPAVIRALAGPLDLPAVPVLVVLYALGVVGIVGNLIIPLSHRR